MATEKQINEIIDALNAMRRAFEASTGAVGAAGTNSINMLNGAGAPAGGLGVNDDYYLNTTNGDVYRKEAGAWVLKANFIGPAGPQGNAGPAGPQGGDGPQGNAGGDGITYTWRYGAGVPDAGLGINGDYYLRTSNSDVYYKAAGAWSVVANIKGETGAQGDQGNPGTNSINMLNGAGAPAGGLGVNDDYYLNTTNGDVYRKEAGAWVLKANFIGPAGPQGNAGADGITYTWRYGAGVPDAGLGINGDYYLRTSNSDVYYKAAGAWSVVANIKGETGETGAQGPQGEPGASGSDLLKAGSGTTTNASAEDVDSVAISGLTDKDSLMILVTLESTTQKTTTPIVRNATDGVTLATIKNSDAFNGAQYQLDMKVRQVKTANTKIYAMAVYGAVGDTATPAVVSILATFTTAWTGNWTLALRHAGVVSGGTLNWSWAVYKLSGQ